MLSDTGDLETQWALAHFLSRAPDNKQAHGNQQTIFPQIIRDTI